MDIFPLLDFFSYFLIRYTPIAGTWLAGKEEKLDENMNKYDDPISNEFLLFLSNLCLTAEEIDTEKSRIFALLNQQGMYRISLFLCFSLTFYCYR